MIVKLKGRFPPSSEKKFPPSGKARHRYGAAVSQHVSARYPTRHKDEAQKRKLASRPFSPHRLQKAKKPFGERKVFPFQNRQCFSSSNRHAI